MVLWVFAESSSQARRWLADNAPGERATIWSGGEAARIAGLRFADGDRVVVVGDIGVPAERVVSRCVQASPGQISLVRAV